MSDKSGVLVVKGTAAHAVQAEAERLCREEGWLHPFGFAMRMKGGELDNHSFREGKIAYVAILLRGEERTV